MGRRIALLFALLVAVPSVAAVPQPALYFLKEGDPPIVGPGVLNGTPPDGLEPSSRPVLIGSSDVPSAVFVLDEAARTELLLGPIFVGLWTGPSLVVDGNITATLYVQEGSSLTPIASASQHLFLNESSAPDPTTLVPPDPTDPEAAAMYIAAQVLAGLIKPPVLMQFGFVEVDVPADATLALGFYLEASEGSQTPIPVGAAATLEYDAALRPTFLYVPWYAPDPDPTQSFTQTQSVTPTPTQGNPTLGGGADDNEDSPGIGVLALLVAIAFVAARRRLR